MWIKKVSLKLWMVVITITMLSNVVFAVPENTFDLCNNLIDDDGDTKIDCADSDCAPQPYCGPEVCGDVIDNDGDGKLDCEDVPCKFWTNCEPENNPFVCNDGYDNDFGGSGSGVGGGVDCADPECSAFPYCTDGTVTIIEGNVYFNTTDSHTNYTNNLNVTTKGVIANGTFLLLTEMHYVNDELGVNITDYVLMDAVDSEINTTAFPFLLDSNNYTKNISSFFDKDLNATLFFNVNNCENISNFVYNTSDDTFQETILPVNITCISNRASSNFQQIQQALPPNYNLITINYLPTSWRLAIITGLMSMSGLFVYVGNKQNSEFIPLKWLLYGIAGLVGLLGIYASVLIANPFDEGVSSLVKIFYNITIIAFGFLFAVVTILLTKRGIELLNKPQW